MAVFTLCASVAVFLSCAYLYYLYLFLHASVEYFIWDRFEHKKPASIEAVMFPKQDFCILFDYYLWLPPRAAKSQWLFSTHHIHPCDRGHHSGRLLFRTYNSDTHSRIPTLGKGVENGLFSSMLDLPWQYRQCHCLCPPSSQSRGLRSRTLQPRWRIRRWWQAWSLPLKQPFFEP